MSCNPCNVPYRISQYHASPDSCVAFPIQSDNLTYSGPNLPCSGIKTCNTLTVALQKIDEKLCELSAALCDCPYCDLIIDVQEITTTTTTTTLSCDVEFDAEEINL